MIMTMMIKYFKLEEKKENQNKKNLINLKYNNKLNFNHNNKNSSNKKYPYNLKIIKIKHK